MHPLIQRAFEYPGAVLMRDDARRFRDPQDVGYEIGVQKERGCQRFCNFFVKYGEIQMYFKHDPATVEETYRRAHGNIEPSEIAPKYWSRMTVLGHEAEAAALLQRSYDLIVAGLPKSEREGLTEFEMPNRFLTFFHAAVAAEALGPKVYTSFNDGSGPSVAVGVQLVASYRFNWLEIRDAPGSPPREVGPEQYAQWPELIRRAVGAFVAAG